MFEIIKNKFIFSAAILSIFVTTFCIYPAARIGEDRVRPGYNEELHELSKIAQLEDGYNISNAVGNVGYNRYFVQTLLNKFASDNDFVHTSKMLQMGADPDSVEGGGEQALFAAIVGGNTKMVKLLLDGGADINAIRTMDNYDLGSYKRYTPILLAVSNGKEPMVEFLIKNGADVNKKDEDGKTPLMIAAQLTTIRPELTEKQILAIIELLIDAGADIKIKDKHGLDALYYAKKNKVVSNFLKDYLSEREMLTIATELEKYLPNVLVGESLSYLPSFKKYQEAFEKHKESKLFESVAPSSCVNCAIL